MDALFQKRFLASSLPYDCFLKLFGVYICPSTITEQKLINVFHLWKLAWFILNFLNQIFSFMRRTIYVKFVPGFLFPFREYLICIVNYSTSCILDAMVHLLLLSSIRRTVACLFLHIENIDSKLQRPKLLKIRRLSIACIYWCFLTVLYTYTSET
jgi:hypothetical protein